MPPGKGYKGKKTTKKPAKKKGGTGAPKSNSAKTKNGSGKFKP